jgi:hypothetical protein
MERKMNAHNTLPNRPDKIQNISRLFSVIVIFFSIYNIYITSTPAALHLQEKAVAVICGINRWIHQATNLLRRSICYYTLPGRAIHLSLNTKIYSYA